MTDGIRPRRPGLLVRLFGPADAVFRLGVSIGHAAHLGFWLGLLGRRRLQALTDASYAERLEGDESSELLDWEVAAFERFFADRRSVVVAGAGAGRELLALAGRGLEVAGFDCEPSLVARARRRLESIGNPGPVLVAEPDEVPHGLGRFEAAVVGWGAYGHIAGRSRRTAFLSRLAEQLEPGSPILLSFFVRDGGPGERFELVARVGNLVRWLRRDHEPVEVGDSIRAGLFTHCQRREELVGEAREAGLEILEYRSTPYGHAVARRS